MNDFAQRLYISTIAQDCRSQALAYGLGLEMAEFCTASNLDQDYPRRRAQALVQMAGIDRSWFHAPFAELCPAAIDPKVRQVTMERYRQAVAAAQSLGICRLVIHSGYIPWVYFPQWFVPQSVRFWQEFLQDMPGDLTIALENVMDPGPDMLVDIVGQVNDPRLGLCLDLGHANTPLSWYPPQDWIGPMLPWLRHVHLHNNDGSQDTHQPLGEGTIPMARLLEELIPLAVTFTIENLHCGPSLDWLCRQGFLPGRKENPHD